MILRTKVVCGIPLQRTTSSKKFQTKVSTEKVMVTVFWNSEGVVLTDFWEEVVIVNQEFWNKTLKKISKIR
jgi:hypothetical protein